MVYKHCKWNLKCISGMNLSPDNKNLFTTFFILILYLVLYAPKTKEDLLKELKGVFILKLHNNPLAPWFFINLHFLLSYTANFDEITILSFFSFLQLLSFSFLYFFYTLTNMITFFDNSLNYLTTILL